MVFLRSPCEKIAMTRTTTTEIFRSKPILDRGDVIDENKVEHCLVSEPRDVIQLRVCQYDPNPASR